MPPGVPGLDRRLTHVFGFGGAMLANLRMNAGVPTVKPDVHVRRFLAPYLGLSEDAADEDFEQALSEGRDELGMGPFEVDQII